MGTASDPDEEPGSHASDAEQRNVAGEQRDRAAALRDLAAEHRDVAAERRNHEADVRDRTAQHRDAIADERDGVGDERDRAADERDQAADRRDYASETQEHEASVSRASAWQDRRASSAERSEAEHDREISLTDRRAGAAERTHAEHDRETAQADREMAAHDRGQASQDDLTSAYLRSAGFAELKREMDRAQRGGQPLAVAFVDVNHLKAINDQHGHAAGDRVLVEVSQALRAKLRSYDLIIRYGGDEFVCALPGVTHAGAARRMSLVNAALKQGSGLGSVTYGLAELRPGDSPDDVVARADAALYEQRRWQGQTDA